MTQPALGLLLPFAGASQGVAQSGWTDLSPPNTGFAVPYQPKTRTAADDELWTRFASGIRKVGG